MRRLTISAPGKLMIAGEYVVLDGVEGLVAAVDARVVAHGSPVVDDRSAPDRSHPQDAPSLPPEALVAREYAEAALGPAAMTFTLDTTSLREGDRKFGLGSSAAASACAAAAVAAYHGRHVVAERRSILRWAIAGHRAIAPQGSGADVVASTLGGVVRFQRDTAEDAQAVAWPAQLHTVVVWTGVPARTSELVAVVRRTATESPARYAEATAPLREAASQLIDSLVACRIEDAIAATAAHHRAAARLGEITGAPIVTEPLARVSALATQFGGAAKPSGAGGGDVAIAFFADRDAADAFVAACPSADLTPLSLALGAEGVRVDSLE